MEDFSLETSRGKAGKHLVSPGNDIQTLLSFILLHGDFPTNQIFTLKTPFLS